MHGASVLDIGGGIGAIGSSCSQRAPSVRRTSSSPTVTRKRRRELIAERGVADRVERRVADIVEDAGAVEPHDVVVMHRVVCCYPDVDALDGRGGGSTRRACSFSRIRRSAAWIGAGLAVMNVWLRLRGCGFRTYLHPVGRIVGAARSTASGSSAA